jgi:hypothetical protein
VCDDSEKRETMKKMNNHAPQKEEIMKTEFKKKERKHTFNLSNLLLASFCWNFRLKNG